MQSKSLFFTVIQNKFMAKISRLREKESLDRPYKKVLLPTSKLKAKCQCYRGKAKNLIR